MAQENIITPCPILIGDMKGTNILEVKNGLIKRCKIKHGKVADMVFEEHKRIYYMVDPNIEAATMGGMKNLDSKKVANDELIKIITTKNNQLPDVEASIWGEINEHCSGSAWQYVTGHIKYPNIKKNADVYALWSLIEEIFPSSGVVLSGDSISSNPWVVLSQMEMLPSEIAFPYLFKERYDTTLALCLKGEGWKEDHVKPSNRVAHFLNCFRTQPQYVPLINEIESKAIFNKVPLPKSVDEAYTLIWSYLSSNEKYFTIINTKVAAAQVNLVQLDVIPQQANQAQRSDERRFCSVCGACGLHKYFECPSIFCTKCGIKGHPGNKCSNSSNKPINHYSFSLYSPINNNTNDTIIDSGSNIHIFRSEFLTNISTVEPMTITNFSKNDVKIDKIGILPFGMGEAFVSDDISLNILSQSLLIRNKINVIYNATSNIFSLLIGENQINFPEMGGLYSCNFREVVNNIIDQDLLYNNIICNNITLEISNSKLQRIRDVEKLYLARLLPSKANLKSYLKNAIFRDEISFDESDIDLFYEYYGKNRFKMKGSMTKRKKRTILPTTELIDKVKEQILYTDILDFEGSKYLLSISLPLGILLVNMVKDMTANTLYETLKNQISRVGSYGFKILKVIADNQFECLTRKFENLVIDTGGSGQNNSNVDIYCRYVRNAALAIRASISQKFNLPRFLNEALIIYVVNRINSKPSSSNTIPAMIRMTGVVPTFKGECDLSFGDFVEVRNDAYNNNKNLEKSLSCIALFSHSNSSETWSFLNINTLAEIKKSHWEKVLENPDIISRMNAVYSQELNSQIDLKFSKLPKSKLLRGINSSKPINEVTDLPAIVSDLEKTNAALPNINVPINPISRKNIAIDQPLNPILTKVHFDENKNVAVDVVTPSQISQNGFSEISSSSQPAVRDSVTTAPSNISESKIEIENNDSKGEVVNVETPIVVEDLGNINQDLRRSDRDRHPPSRYANNALCNYSFSLQNDGSLNIGNKFCLATRIKNYNRSKMSDDAKKAAIKAELQQMIDKGVWKYIKYDYGCGIRPITSGMFTVVKNDPNGIFIKVKARLVVHGNQQSRILLPDQYSSPTVMPQHTKILLALAQKQNKKLAVCDIGGAYLNADMPDLVYVSIDRNLTAMLVEMDPKAAEFVNNDGKLIVQLQKALYGCVQSGKLWYDNLKAFLLSIGFKVNGKDGCVFSQKMGNNDFVTISTHGDDLLITYSEEKNLDEIVAALIKKYTDVKVKRGGKTIDYLGMRITIEADNSFHIDMPASIEELTQDISNFTNYPCKVNLVDINRPNVDKSLLDFTRKNIFRSKIASLLFISRMVRPDIFFVVSYLGTRVSDPNTTDWEDLQLLLMYLKNTKNNGLIFKCNSDSNLIAYIDASFGTYSDCGKGQSGIVIQFSGCTIHCSSTKQRLISLSSTESEIIGVSDKISHVIECFDFLVDFGIDVNIQLNIPTVFQDSKPAIELMIRSKNEMRTRHLNNRRYNIRDLFNTGKFVMKYLPTEEMLADVMTKPLCGDHFINITKQIMGHEINYINKNSFKGARISDKRTELRLF